MPSSFYIGLLQVRHGEPERVCRPSRSTAEKAHQLQSRAGILYKSGSKTQLCCSVCRPSYLPAAQQTGAKAWQWNAAGRSPIKFTFHCIALNFTVLLCISLQCISLQCIESQCKASHFTGTRIFVVLDPGMRMATLHFTGIHLRFSIVHLHYILLESTCTSL